MDAGVEQGPCFQEKGGQGGLGGRGGQGGGARARGGCKGFGSGGVGGRDTGPREANFATCVVFLLFLSCLMAFFEGCPVGWGGGVPTGAGLVDGG